MPSVEITEGQAALFAEVLDLKRQAERELRLVTMAILAGHGVAQAHNIDLVRAPGATPLLVYQVPVVDDTKEGAP